MSAPLRTVRPRNVAVLVHNDIIRDARVLKEVQTLGAFGHKVDVIGASPMPGQYPATVPGACTLTIINISPKTLQGKLYHLAERVYARALDYLLTLFTIVPLCALLTYARSLEELARWLFIASPILLLGARSINLSTPQHRRNAKALTGLAVGVLFLAGIYSVAVGKLGVVTLFLVVSLLVGISLSTINLRRTGIKLINWLRSSRVVSYRRKRWYEIADQLASAVDPKRHDTIHCHDIIALAAGVRLKKSYPCIRLVWDAHEYYEEVASGSEDDRTLVREIIRSAEGRVDAFITISESFQEIYARRYPGLPPALVVMNATRYAGVVWDDGRLHRAAGLSASRRILLFQGGFSPHRGIGHLVEAARSLPDPWSIVLMGWGKLEPEIHAASAELTDLRHPERAPLVAIPAAPQAELPYWSAGATLGVIPYENKGMNHLYCTPNKLWEFPNAGVPILATALVEMERIIGAWKTGFLLPRDFTAQDVRDRLTTITDEELAQARRNCRTFSEAMSWDRFEDELLKAYAA